MCMHHATIFSILSFVHTLLPIMFKIICDRISENGSKSHMKSIVFQHVLNCISSYVHVFSEYLLNSFDNLNIKFHVNDMK